MERQVLKFELLIESIVTFIHLSIVLNKSEKFFAFLSDLIIQKNCDWLFT